MFFCLALGKEKLLLPDQNYLILGKEKALCTCILDCDWSESRLPWLDRVLLCVVGVGLNGVSWAVRYLDKP